MSFLVTQAERVPLQEKEIMGDSIMELGFLGSGHAMLVLDEALNVHAINKAGIKHFSHLLPEVGDVTAATEANNIADLKCEIQKTLSDEASIGSIVKRASLCSRRFFHRPASVALGDHDRVTFEFVRVGQQGKKPLVGLQIVENQNLIRKVSGLNEALEYERHVSALQKESAEKLKDLNDKLNRFAYAAAHDLQEPVRVISILADFISSHNGDLPEEEIQNCLDQMGKHAQRARKLVVEILEFSRITDMEITFQLVSLSKLFRSTLGLFADSLEPLESEFKLDNLGTAYCDERMMRMLFQNIISNSIKYRKDDMVEMHVSSRLENNGRVLAFKDHGVGFDPRFSEEIFSPFKRLHRHDEVEGSGIGLSLCRTVVERHGGRMWTDAVEGKGATFYVWLPLVQESALRTGKWQDRRLH